MTTHPVHEPHAAGVSRRLNWLRAGVLGANDGLVSTAGLVVGVAGATADKHTLFISGMAGMLAGSLSMAVGEYVSVSTQRDTERALIALETRELEEQPEAELTELADLYRAKGLSPDLSHRVARELTAKNALGAHLDIELGIDPDELTNPWHAAFASFAAFLVGAAIPLLAILLSPASVRLPVTWVAVLIGMAFTGGVSAHLGGAPKIPAITRNLVGGAIVMAITYTVGRLIGGAAG